MITFSVQFHGPFHVAQGTAGEGADRTIDPVNPLPATSLKGLMRSEARVGLGVPDNVVRRIFGSTNQPSPWRWSDLRFDAKRVPIDRLTRSARIHVSEFGAASEGFIAIGEDVWLTSGQFKVSRQYDGGPAAHEDDLLVLRASARSVTALGGGRRRGSGWVSITDEQEWTDAHTERFLRLTRPEGV